MACRCGADWPRRDTNVSESYAVKPLIPKLMFRRTLLVRVVNFAPFFNNPNFSRRCLASNTRKLFVVHPTIKSALLTRVAGFLLHQSVPCLYRSSRPTTTTRPIAYKRSGSSTSQRHQVLLSHPGNTVSVTSNRKPLCNVGDHGVAHLQVILNISAWPPGFPILTGWRVGELGVNLADAVDAE